MLSEYFVQQLEDTGIKIAMGTGVIISDVTLPHASTELLINVIILFVYFIITLA